MGQRSKATPYQTKKEDSLQDEKCVPLVVLKLSSNFGTSSSSTSLPQKSSSTATERSHDQAPGNWRDSRNQNENKKRDNDGDSEDRWRNLPEWSQKFTENLEDTEVLAHDSDSERPTKVASRKHNIFVHIQKNRKCDVCLRTKMTRAPCRRRTGEAVPGAEKFGDLITADHKVLNGQGESQNNHQHEVVVQDLATQSIQSYPCKTKNFSGNRKEFKKVSRAVEKSRRSLTVTIHWNLAKPVKICHGIIEHRHLIDLRQMATLKEPHDE